MNYNLNFSMIRWFDEFKDSRGRNHCPHLPIRFLSHQIRQSTVSFDLISLVQLLTFYVPLSRPKLNWQGSIRSISSCYMWNGLNSYSQKRHPFPLSTLLIDYSLSACLTGDFLDKLLRLFSYSFYYVYYSCSCGSWVASDYCCCWYS